MSLLSWGSFDESADEEDETSSASFSLFLVIGLRPLSLISASLFLDLCFFVSLFRSLSVSLLGHPGSGLPLSISSFLFFDLSLSLGLDLSFLSQFLSTSLYISAFLLFSVSSPPLSISISLFSVSFPLSIFPTFLSSLLFYKHKHVTSALICLNKNKQKETTTPLLWITPIPCLS